MVAAVTVVTAVSFPAATAVPCNSVNVILTVLARTAGAMVVGEVAAIVSVVSRVMMVNVYSVPVLEKNAATMAVGEVAGNVRVSRTSA